MNCRDVKPLLTAYIDGEANGYEQTLIEAHLAECQACEDEVSQLRITRKRVQREIKNWAASAVPPPSAWDGLMAKIAAEKVSVAQSVSLATPPTNPLNNRFRGGIKMVRRFALTGLVTALIAATFVMTVRNTPTVSAQEILDRAQAAQAVTQIQGILHLKSETYWNYALLGKGAAVNESHSLIESYRDYETGKQRMSLSDFKTGDVGEASAYDGTAVYTARPGEDPSGKLLVYRSTRIKGMQEEIASMALEAPNDYQQSFEDMKKDPNVELVGEQTWTTGDGREVYVLRSKIAADRKSGTGTAYSVLYFDAQNYRFLENQVTVEQDGKELMAGYNRELVYEILPSDANVIWDLSDLKNAVIVEDPNSDHVDLLPESITQAELVKRFKSPYLLKTVPDGFTLKITAPPKPNEGDDVFLIDYRTLENRYFFIQSSQGPASQDDNPQRNYQTSSGLKVHVVDESDSFNGDTISNVTVDLADGSHLMITSNLPLDQVKAWIEDLVPAT